jgi:hypothetical protein
LSADKAEQAVWAHIQRSLSNSELLRTRYQEGVTDPTMDIAAAQEHARLERKLQAFAREIQRLIDAYQTGVIELPDLQTRRQRIEDHSRVFAATTHRTRRCPYLSPTATPNVPRGRGVLYEYAGSVENYGL